jgi:hypothetical protein
MKYGVLPNTDPIGTRQLMNGGYNDDKRLIITHGPQLSKGPYPAGTKANPGNSAVYQRTDQEINRLVEHDSESEFDGSFDMDKEYLVNMRPPLRSSSPKPERPSTLATETDFYTSDIPLRDIGDANDSDVTSLLSSATALSGDTIDHQNSLEESSAKPRIMPSGTSDQRYLSSIATHQSKTSNKQNTGTRRTGSRISHKKTSRRRDGMSSK